MNRGTIQIELGLLNEAITSFSKAIELEPTLRSAYDERSKVYLKLGRKDDAAADRKQSDALLAKVEQLRVTVKLP